ncbi:hypothetical protein KM043_013906 [Ampulex compressa]|nr:hypothetical protein KM043_013906 [Ampulex compressa]
MHGECENPTGRYPEEIEEIEELLTNVFHICDNGRKISFLCPNGTIFQQSQLICDWWFKVNCSKSAELYEQNAEQLVEDERKRTEAKRPKVFLDYDERQNPRPNPFVQNRGQNYKQQNQIQEDGAKESFYHSSPGHIITTNDRQTGSNGPASVNQRDNSNHWPEVNYHLDLNRQDGIDKKDDSNHRSESHDQIGPNHQRGSNHQDNFRNQEKVFSVKEDTTDNQNNREKDSSKSDQSRTSRKYTQIQKSKSLDELSAKTQQQSRGEKAISKDKLKTRLASKAPYTESTIFRSTSTTPLMEFQQFAESAAFVPSRGKSLNSHRFYYQQYVEQPAEKFVETNTRPQEHGQRNEEGRLPSATKHGYSHLASRQTEKPTTTTTIDIELSTPYSIYEEETRMQTPFIFFKEDSRRSLEDELATPGTEPALYTYDQDGTNALCDSAPSTIATTAIPAYTEVPVAEVVQRLQEHRRTTERTLSPYDTSFTYRQGKVLSTLGPYLAFSRSYPIVTTVSPAFKIERTSELNYPGSSDKKHALTMLQSLRTLEGPLKGEVSPSTLHSLALYFATAGESLEDDGKKEKEEEEDKEYTTPEVFQSKDESLETLPTSILTKNTVKAYARIFNLDDTYPWINASRQEDSSKALELSKGEHKAEEGTEKTRLRDLVRIFAEALSAYLKDPEYFKTILEAAAPTEPAKTNDDQKWAKVSLSTNSTNEPTSVKLAEELLKFSDADNEARSLRQEQRNNWSNTSAIRESTKNAQKENPRPVQSRNNHWRGKTTWQKTPENPKDSVATKSRKISTPNAKSNSISNTKQRNTWRESLILSTRSRKNWQESTVPSIRLTNTWQESTTLPGNLKNSWQGGTTMSPNLNDPWEETITTSQTLNNPWQETSTATSNLISPWQETTTPTSNLKNLWQETTTSSENLKNPWRRTTISSSNLKNPWQDTTTSFQDFNSPWQETTTSSENLKNPWGETTTISPNLKNPWRETTNSFEDLKSPWQETTTSSQNLKNPWRETTISSPNLKIPWQESTTSIQDLKNLWQETTTSSQYLKSPWRDATISSENLKNPWEETTISPKNLKISWKETSSSSQNLKNSWEETTTVSQNLKNSWEETTISSQGLKNLWPETTTFFQNLKNPWDETTTLSKNLNNPWEETTVSPQNMQDLWQDITNIPRDLKNPWLDSSTRPVDISFAFEVNSLKRLGGFQNNSRDSYDSYSTPSTISTIYSSRRPSQRITPLLADGQNHGSGSTPVYGGGNRSRELKRGKKPSLKRMEEHRRNGSTLPEGGNAGDEIDRDTEMFGKNESSNKKGRSGNEAISSGFYDSNRERIKGMSKDQSTPPIFYDSQSSDRSNVEIERSKNRSLSPISYNSRTPDGEHIKEKLENRSVTSIFHDSNIYDHSNIKQRSESEVKTSSFFNSTTSNRPTITDNFNIRPTTSTYFNSKTSDQLNTSWRINEKKESRSEEVGVSETTLPESTKIEERGKKGFLSDDHWTSSPMVTQLWESTVFVDPKRINDDLESSWEDAKVTTMGRIVAADEPQNIEALEHSNTGRSTPWRSIPSDSQQPTSFSLLPVTDEKNCDKFREHPRREQWHVKTDYHDEVEYNDHDNVFHDLNEHGAEQSHIKRHPQESWKRY